MPGPAQDISKAKSPHSSANKAARFAWGIVQATLFRLSPKPMHRWRAMLLRVFGADIASTARVYPRARVWGPWNLTMRDYATLADDVDCYCVARVTIGAHAVVSQYTYLCGATHDHELSTRPLVPMPITIGDSVWIAADVFVGPGVTIGEGTVVGARSSVFGDLPAWKVCHGSPAKPIKDRVLRDAPSETVSPAIEHQSSAQREAS